MTPAIQFLKKSRVAQRVHRYDAADLPEGETYGEAVAAALGVEPERMFKTLIAELKGGELVVAIVPVHQTLDLRALARSAGAKSAEMAAPEAAERATGYVTGGISPFGQKRRLRAFVDESMTHQSKIFVSAGRRGLQLELAPEAVTKTLGAIPVELSAF